MNRLLNDAHLSVHGLDAALEMAQVLIKNDYQVMIQLDDVDIYIVSYAHNDLNLGASRFALVTEEEEYELAARREWDKTQIDDDYYDDDDDDDDEEQEEVELFD